MCLIPGQAPDLGFRRRRLIPCLNVQECGWKPVRGPETASRSMRVRRRPSHIWKCGICCLIIVDEVTIPPAGGASAVVSWKLPARACQVNPGGWKIRLGTLIHTPNVRVGAIRGSDDESLSCRNPVRDMQQGTNQVRHRPVTTLCTGAHGSPDAAFRTRAFTAGTNSDLTARPACETAPDLGTHATDSLQRSPTRMANLPSTPRQVGVRAAPLELNANCAT